MKIKDFVRLLDVDDLEKDIIIVKNGEKATGVDIIIGLDSVNIIARDREVIKDA